MVSDTDCYHTYPGFSPVWRDWDGEVVVFDRNSGDTHCFDELTALMLSLLSEEALTMSGLTGRVAEALEFGADGADLAKRVENTVKELMIQNLVVTVVE